MAYETIVSNNARKHAKTDTVFIRLTALRFLNFSTLRVGAYSRWALIRGWALIKFSPFSASEVCVFCNKTTNANKKTQRSNKARFL